MENIWARSLKDNKEIIVKIEPVYIRNSDRPNSINVTYKIGN
ncbi:DNA/RNA non-specific endonuclease [Proteus terrae]|nr:DNA/RNA non-specific endonuclease [Proteus terrae]MCE9841421.1 DNA/RNA non-specific endonuclease [Proteus terrae]